MDRFSASGELADMLADIQSAETVEDLRQLHYSLLLAPANPQTSCESLRDILMVHTWDFARQTGREHPHAVRRVMALACMFSTFIRRDLTAGQLAQAIADNAKGDPRTCATHDYCDANVCMIHAQAALGMVHDAASQECADLVNAAWSCAKACGFDPVRIVGDFDAES